MKTVKYILFQLSLLLLHCTTSATTVYAKSFIDPIKFSISTKATHVGLNEEFQIDIRASYMYIPANTVFVFEGANSFRLKAVLPDGFVQTGGTFTDFVGDELSSTKPYVSYTIKGKFTRDSGDGVFQLLRSHRKADNQSTYVQVSTLSFSPDTGREAPADSNARIALVNATPGYIPYMTIAELRAGLADTAKAVFVIDEDRNGLFRLNPTSTAPDDGAMTIVSSSKRYERVYDGAVNVRWFGIIADGATDQSIALQKMLDNAKYRNVFFPRGASAYKIKTIRLWNNTTLTFEEGTVVEGTGTLASHQKLIYMYDVQNINIRGYGVTFRDLRAKYTSGQQRHIFSMEGVLNVTLEGMAANDSGGDGFYIGSGSARKVSENIRILHVSANNNRRQGLSITSGKNIQVVNPVLTNTTGEGPQAGIDIEPSLVEQRLEGIRIENPVTGGNKGPGIVIAPGVFANTDRLIDVVITNHLDDGSMYGFLATGVKGVLGGTITIENPRWTNNKLCGFVSRDWGYRACPVVVLNPTIINCNTNRSTSPTAGAAFYIHREAGDVGDTHLGNINIFSPTIMDTRTPMAITRAFSFKDWNTSNKILNCSIIDPIKSASTFPQNNMIVNTELNLSDKNRTMVHEIGGAGTIADYTYYRPLYINQTSTTGRNVVLGKVNAGFPEITIEVRSPYNIYVVPNATDNIMPLSSVNGKYITSKVVGSRLRLRKTTDNSWHIVEMVGTWTVQP